MKTLTSIWKTSKERGELVASLSPGIMLLALFPALKRTSVYRTNTYIYILVFSER